jgi:hypothetical protein
VADGNVRTGVYLECRHCGRRVELGLVDLDKPRVMWQCGGCRRLNNQTVPKKPTDG